MNEKVSFDDNIVIVPVELARDLKVNGDGIALYTVMKSFGPRAEAKVETYGLRLNWHPKTVRRWQRLLQTEGWIFLLREGDADRPRLWWMCRFKGQIPTPDEVAGVTNLGIPKNGMPKLGDPQNRHPKKGYPKQKKVFKQLEGCSSSQKGEAAAKASARKCRRCGPTHQAILSHNGLCLACTEAESHA